MLRLFTAIAAAVALAGCGGGKADPDPPAPTPPPTNAQQLEDLLDRRAGALSQGRPRALAETSVAGHTAAQRRSARVASRLGLRDLRYAIDGADIGRRRARLRVRLTYGVRGVEGSFGVPRTLTAKRTRKGWRLDGGPGARNVDPWDLAAYRRVQTPHFVVWAPPGAQVPEAALEAGYARMQEVLRRARLRDRYLVLIARDAEDAHRLTQHITGLESLTALTDTQVSVKGPALRVDAIKSQRLILVESRFGAGTLDEQREIVTHELTHAALAPQTSGRVPSWLVEGLAEYVSEDDRREEADYYRSVGLAPTLGSLSAPDMIGRLGGDLQSAAYAEASAAAYNIALRHGRDKLMELYLVFNDPKLRGKRGDPRMVRRAVRRVLGISLEDLQ
jgi:hypothetical protein